MLKSALIIGLTLVSMAIPTLSAENSSAARLLVSEHTLTIYPNPVVDEFWIEGIEEGSLVQIFNYKNELVYEIIRGGSGSTGNVGGINPLKAGTYTVVVNDQTGILIKVDG